MSCIPYVCLYIDPFLKVMEMDIKEIRKETLGAKKVIHFNNAGSSLPPKCVTETVIDYLTEESQVGGYESFEKELIVTEDVKEKNHHTPFDGPTKLIKELKESNEWELFNFFNNGVMKEKPSTTGLTLLQRCRI